MSHNKVFILRTEYQHSTFQTFFCPFFDPLLLHIITNTFSTFSLSTQHRETTLFFIPPTITEITQHQHHEQDQTPTTQH